jgi:hypothetical protein
MHGIFDYALGLTLLTPYVVEYFAGGKDTWMLGLIGSLIIIYSLVTEYELGIMKIIPMKAHLVLDVVTGIVLFLLPFIFPMIHYYLYWPCILGISMVALAVLSSSAAYHYTKKDFDITRP